MAKKLKIALYPGTFDPITNGHVSIIKRGRAIFDLVIVGVAMQTSKTPLFSLDERVTLAREVFADDPGVEIAPFDGLTVEYAKKRHAQALLRGLRAVSDFDYELQLALMNRRLDRNMETVFMMTDYKWLYISSTIIKAVAGQRGDIRGLVPENVRIAMEMKFGPAHASGQ